MKLLIFKLISFALFVVVAGSCSNYADLPVQINSKQENNSSNTDEIKDFTEPALTDALSSSRYTAQIKKAWQKFSEGNKYRLARKEDMKFSPAALEDEKKREGRVNRLFVPFAYAWGSLGYPQKNAQDHLAALVIDNDKSEDDKFNLVIFSPPQDNSDEYTVHWLYRNIDLSKTAFSAPSGYLFIHNYSEDGTIKGCSVEWNKKLKNFQCK